jgi:hypothetical protein
MLIPIASMMTLMIAMLLNVMREYAKQLLRRKQRNVSAPMIIRNTVEKMRMRPQKKGIRILMDTSVVLLENVKKQRTATGFVIVLAEQRVVMEEQQRAQQAVRPPGPPVVAEDFQVASAVVAVEAVLEEGIVAEAEIPEIPETQEIRVTRAMHLRVRALHALHQRLPATQDMMIVCTSAHLRDSNATPAAITGRVPRAMPVCQAV